MTTPALQLRRANRASVLLLALLGSLALAVGATVWLLASGSSSSTADRDELSPAAARAAFAETTGVEIVRVAITAGGGGIDLRYRVIDPDKAPIVHNTKRPPAIIVDEQGSRVLDEPFMGHTMKPRSMRAGQVYYHLLLNKQGVVTRGDRVTVRMGGVTLKDIAVR